MTIGLREENKSPNSIAWALMAPFAGITPWTSPTLVPAGVQFLIFNLLLFWGYRVVHEFTTGTVLRGHSRYGLGRVSYRLLVVKLGSNMCKADVLLPEPTACQKKEGFFWRLSLIWN